MSTIYYNGKIITMNDALDAKGIEAVLVKKGKIEKVGTLEEVKSASKRATMVDLQGKCLLPGFIDPHSHFVSNGQLSMCVDLSECNCFDDVINTLTKYIEDNKITKDGIVVGFGYDHNFLEEYAQPDKFVLDKVSKDIPIMALHVSLHLGCANSAALKLAGIDENTPDIEGGKIERVEGTMEPTGYLEEAAFHKILATGFSKIKINPLDVMKHMQDAYVMNGVTTAQDGATTENELKTLKALALSKMLKIDIVCYPTIMSMANGQEILHNNEKYVGTYKNHIKIGGYKLILDGSPQGRSAWMSEPYLGGEEGYCGYPWIKDEEVENCVRIAVTEGKQLLTHCNGDAASEQLLNAYEKILKETGSTADLRPVMIHCQTVRNDQLDRMAKINMVASIFVGHVNFWGDVHVRNFGEKRGNHISPAKDALDRGIHVNFHQDTPVTKPNMLHSVWCAVNRLSRSGKVIGEDQKVSVYDALKAVTIEGAYQYFEENEKGTIEEGKRADLVILDKSPLDVDVMAIKDIQVLETIKDGKTIYTK